MTKAGFTPISFDAYINLHMKSNPKDMAREEVVSVLRSALTAHKNGAKCHCGNPIWVIGSAFVGNACFTCITGEAYPDSDYEIEEAM
jgi:hypothetical protein